MHDKIAMNAFEIKSSGICISEFDGHDSFLDSFSAISRIDVPDGNFLKKLVWSL